MSYLEYRRNLKLKGKVEQPKEKKSINKESDKRKEVNKDYMKIVKDIKSARPYCELKTPVCTGRTQGLHHIQKRNRSNLKEFSNLLASCNRCNLWVEEHPKEAIKLGISKSKFKQ